MIWFLLGATPFVALLIVGFVKEPEVMLFTVCTVAVLLGLLLLVFYGGWQMHWFNHCGDFWESYDCTGKVTS